MYRPFQTWQLTNHIIYGQRNEGVYKRTADLAVKLAAHAGMVSKELRPNARVEYGKQLEKILCVCFSWSMATANRLGVILDIVVWDYFPYRCPYCGECPCTRKDGKRMKLPPRPGVKKPESIEEYQAMFASIYPHNTAEDSARHLLEEATELGEAINALEHGIGSREKVEKELVDVVANMFGVANCSKIPLSSSLRMVFQNGCHRCHQIPCREGFTIAADSITLPPKLEML